MVERLPVKEMVPGSSPGAGAVKLIIIKVTLEVRRPACPVVNAKRSTTGVNQLVAGRRS